MTGGQPGEDGGVAGEPFISVIVPTHGRPESLARCLESLAELEYPADRFEVIVVDDGSPRPPDPISCVRSPQNFRIVRQRRTGPGRARNTGAAEARGEFLAFTDDDCRPDRLWLTFLSERLLTDPQIAVGGKTVNTLSENPYSAASQLLIDYLYAAFNPDPNRVSFLASNNFSLSACAWSRGPSISTSSGFHSGTLRVGVPGLWRRCCCFRRRPTPPVSSRGISGRRQRLDTAASGAPAAGCAVVFPVLGCRRKSPGADRANPPWSAS